MERFIDFSPSQSGIAAKLILEMFEQL